MVDVVSRAAARSSEAYIKGFPDVRRARVTVALSSATSEVILFFRQTHKEGG